MYQLDTRREDTSVETILRRVQHRLRQEQGSLPEPMPSEPDSCGIRRLFDNIHIEPEMYFTLDYAGRIYDPRTVPGNTRFRRLKGIVMRVMRLYTTRQVEFNGTVLRVLNAMFDKLHEIVDQFNYFREAEVRLQQRIEQDETAQGAFLEQLHGQRQRIERLEGRERILDRRLSHVENLENRLAHALAENIALRQRLDSLVLHWSGTANPAETKQVTGDDHAALLNEHLYLPLLNEDRGIESVIKARVQRYLPLFARQADAGTLAKAPVLDVGCGRGEFLDACREARIPCQGVDINEDMARQCEAKGHRVACADAVQHLRSLGDRSLRGIVAIQVVEHLPPAQVIEFLKLSVHKLSPGGRLVIETPNVTSFFALSMFYRDFTHQQPIHPDTLTFMLQSLGMREIKRLDLSPVDEALRLDPVEEPAMAANIRKLNDIVYGHLDYAILAEKP